MSLSDADLLRFLSLSLLCLDFFSPICTVFDPLAAAPGALLGKAAAGPGATSSPEAGAVTEHCPRQGVLAASSLQVILHSAGARRMSLCSKEALQRFPTSETSWMTQHGFEP